MKKLILSLSTIALIIAGIFTFAGCEKEETTDIRPVTAVGECPTCSGTDMSLDSLVYVQTNYFFENYGIDIHEFSGNANFQQLITEINDMTLDIYEFMANADPAQLEESRLFLEQKTEEPQMHEGTNNTSGMLSVAEEIFATVMPGKPTNPYTYRNHTFQLPVDYLEMKTDAISNAMHHLKMTHPTLQDMPEEDFQTLLQISFIASEINGYNGLCYAKQEPNPRNKANLEKCIQTAGVKFTAVTTYESARLSIGLVGCAKWGHPALIGGCLAIQLGLYAKNIYDAKAVYDTEIGMCNSLYNH